MVRSIPGYLGIGTVSLHSADSRILLQNQRLSGGQNFYHLAMRRLVQSNMFLTSDSLDVRLGSILVSLRPERKALNFQKLVRRCQSHGRLH